MIVTPQIDRDNQRIALIVTAFTAVALALLGLFYPPLAFTVLLSALVYWWIRRRVWRRLAVVKRPFPPQWEGILRSHVTYYNALPDPDKDRFRKLVQIFLDEVRITGIRTKVDDTTRLLVAASAIIPIFGFPDWEYSGLGEVLIYPGRFGHNYGTEAADRPSILGMVGLGYLNGVMVLSQPDLISGFQSPTDKRNVGIHEFAHLVDKADGSVDGVPALAPPDVARPWIEFVGRELLNRPKGRSHIDQYGYTDESEYFAVLSEYFFENPQALERKSPELYAMLQKMYRQDTRKLLAGVPAARPQRLGRNSPCPCGSGKKYKHCCLAVTRN